MASSTEPPASIHVTVVHPGLTRTEAAQKLIVGLAAARTISGEEAERALAANSIRRIVDAAEIANAVAFLAPNSVSQ